MIQEKLEIEDKEKLENSSGLMNKDEVFGYFRKYRIKRQSIVVNGSMDDYYVGLVLLETQRLHDLEYAKKVDNPYTVRCFMDYLKKAHNEIYQKMK